MNFSLSLDVDSVAWYVEEIAPLILIRLMEGGVLNIAVVVNIRLCCFRTNYLVMDLLSMFGLCSPNEHNIFLSWSTSSCLSALNYSCELIIPGALHNDSIVLKNSFEFGKSKKRFTSTYFFHW